MARELDCSIDGPRGEETIMGERISELAEKVFRAPAQPDTPSIHDFTPEEWIKLSHEHFNKNQLSAVHRSVDRRILDTLTFKS